MSQKLRANFPAKTNILFEPHRYKVLYGGRGSGKSYAVARYLLLAGLSERIRVLCTREVQKSIRDSVKRLLEDQIETLGLQSHYQSYEAEIRGKNGTLFLFNGLSTETVDSLKSYENLAKVWCEEAHSISKRSWDILIPTVRADGSEILITFNPSLDTDETYQRFVLNPPPDCVSVSMNYRDNPWFPAVLEQERLHCEKTDPDEYNTIWEGKCRPAQEGAIYFKQIQAAEAAGQICRLPYDPLLKVHVVMDLGFGHNMSVGCVQKNLSEIRIIDYFQVQGWDLNDVSIELRKRKYNWGRVWLPHDGFSADHKMKTTSQGVLLAQDWDVPGREEIVELSVEDGIRLVQMTFPQLYFDATRCGPVKDDRPNGGLIYGGLLECIKRYHRRMNQQTNTFGAPAQDQWTDGADFLRYVCVNAPSMMNSDPGEMFWDDDHNKYDERAVNAATGY